MRSVCKPSAQQRRHTHLFRCFNRRICLESGWENSWQLYLHEVKIKLWIRGGRMSEKAMREIWKRSHRLSAQYFPFRHELTT